jgi:hypothetical protein
MPIGQGENMKNKRSTKKKVETPEQFTLELEEVGHFVQIEICGQRFSCIMIPVGESFKDEFGEECQSYRFYDWQTKRLIDPVTNELCEEFYDVENKH